MEPGVLESCRRWLMKHQDYRYLAMVVQSGGMLILTLISRWRLLRTINLFFLSKIKNMFCKNYTEVNPGFAVWDQFAAFVALTSWVNMLHGDLFALMSRSLPHGNINWNAD